MMDIVLMVIVAAALITLGCIAASVPPATPWCVAAGVAFASAFCIYLHVTGDDL